MSDTEKLRSEVERLEKVVNQCMGKIEALEMREAALQRALESVGNWRRDMVHTPFEPLELKMGAVGHLPGLGG